jgi:hypothetical protein
MYKNSVTALQNVVVEDKTDSWKNDKQAMEFLMINGIKAEEIAGLDEDEIESYLSMLGY